MNKSIFISLLLLTTTFFSCNTDAISYFDQEPPEDLPVLFAPSLVNTDSIELNVVFNAFGTEMFFSRIVDRSFIIFHSELVNGKWSAIEPIQMYPDSVTISVACDPTITVDGSTMYFLGVDPKLYSNEITPAELYFIPPDIYRSKKVNGKWQLATRVGDSVSTAYLESYPVVVADGSLYFHSNRPSERGGRNAYRAQYLGNDQFDEPVMVEVDTKDKTFISYVSPDEQYAITNGGGRFQIVYKENNEWLAPKEVSMEYEPDWVYYCPYMSSDGKYFIFSRRYHNPAIRGWAGVEQGEVYWVNADIMFGSR